MVDFSHCLHVICVFKSLKKLLIYLDWKKNMCFSPSSVVENLLFLYPV